MTHPIELRENTYLSQNYYPLNLFLNYSPAGDTGRNVLYLHWHDHFELIYMTAGNAIFHIDRQQYDVSPGDILIVPSGALHVGYSTSHDEVKYWALVFNRSLLEGQTRDLIHNRYVTPFLTGKLRFPVNINNGELLASVRDNFEAIIYEFGNKEPAYELVVKARINLLFTMLARNSLQEHEDHSTEYNERRVERLKSLILHIQTRYEEKLSLTEAARIVNLTPNHFCSLFKAATGLTFVDYMNRLRMDQAEALLREGASVTEAASQVGCGNLNYFTKLYKKIKGRTPSETKRTASVVKIRKP